MFCRYRPVCSMGLNYIECCSSTRPHCHAKEGVSDRSGWTAQDRLVQHLPFEILTLGSVM